MNEATTRSGALAGIRVVDLGLEPGALCGKLLADLGAEVVLVEPPGGHPHRHVPPFLGDSPGVERSLTFLHYHTGKRSVCLDFEKPADRDRFVDLVSGADIVIDGSQEDGLNRLGVGDRALCKRFPKLVWARITPFGLDGPAAGRIGSELTTSAAGGFLMAMGYKEDPPLRAGGDQAYHAASQQTAAAVLAALRVASASGQGQVIDVSIAECVAALCDIMAVGTAVDGSDQGRTPRPGPLHPPGDGFFPCKDGWIAAGGGPVPLRHWREFIQWMGEDGIALEWQGDDRWLEPAFRLAHRDEVDRTVRSFFIRHTMDELCDGSIPRGFMLFPVQDPRSLFADPQLRERGFFQPLEDEGRDITLDYPGPPFRLGATPAKIVCPAPLLAPGGKPVHWLRTPESSGSAVIPRSDLLHSAIVNGLAGGEAPLSGLRVIALSWYIAGPMVGRWLADLGAEVIKVETRSRPDPARAIGPVSPTIPLEARTPDMGSWFNTHNCGVRDVTLNLSDERGRDLLRRLIDRADVFIESFAPGTIERWGLAPDDLLANHPRLIILRMPLVGSVGPRSGLSGGGNHLTAYSGLMHLTGFSEGPPAPVGPRNIHPDYGPNPLHGLIAVLAAMHHKERTSEGQVIEIAQFESVVTMNGPALLEYAANGTVAGRHGNHSAIAAPHNAYRCRDSSTGGQQWCAIAVQSDREWQSMVDAIGNPLWAGDPRFATLKGRKANEADLDDLVETWTRGIPAEDVAERLQRAGIAAEVVRDGAGLLADPQFAHRAHYRRLPHAVTPDLPLGRLGFRLPRFDIGPKAAAPLLGEHTNLVLTETLGLEAGAIELLRRNGVLD